jgi:SAM-dependent methyltransferase
VLKSRAKLLFIINFKEITIMRVMDYGEEISFIDPFIGSLNGMHILDIGCREGMFLLNLYEMYSERISKIIGIDKDDINKYKEYNGAYIRKLIKSGIAEFHVCDGLNFMLGLGNKQNLIIFSNVFHLMPLESAITLLDQAMSILTDDGVLYVKVANEHHSMEFPWNENILNLIKEKYSAKVIEKRSKHYELIL